MGDFMAKRDDGKKAAQGAGTTGRVEGDGVEQRVVAFAEQLGRIAGTVAVKAEGLLDRDALNEQVRNVRDSAADLLKHLGGDEPAASAKRRPAAAPGKSAGSGKPAPARNPAGSASNNGASGGRSGGVVDAPGKRHRQPIPSPSTAMASNTRTANTMVSKSRIAKMKLTSRRRG
jgi:hypothetical protein